VIEGKLAGLIIGLSGSPPLRQYRIKGDLAGAEGPGDCSEPSRISMYHCLECQRRNGAVISNQTRFRRKQVTFAGRATALMRTAESLATGDIDVCRVVLVAHQPYR
jgi:hypothetical protein